MSTCDGTRYPRRSYRASKAPRTEKQLNKRFRVGRMSRLRHAPPQAFHARSLYCSHHVNSLAEFESLYSPNSSSPRSFHLFTYIPARIILLRPSTDTVRPYCRAQNKKRFQNQGARSGALRRRTHLVLSSTQHEARSTGSRSLQPPYLRKRATAIKAPTVDTHCCCTRTRSQQAKK